MEPLFEVPQLWPGLYTALLKQSAWLVALFVGAFLGCYILFLTQALRGREDDDLTLRFADRQLIRRSLLRLRRRRGFPLVSVSEALQRSTDEVALRFAGKPLVMRSLRRLRRRRFPLMFGNRS